MGIIRDAAREEEEFPYEMREDNRRVVLTPMQKMLNKEMMRAFRARESAERDLDIAIQESRALHEQKRLIRMRIKSADNSVKEIGNAMLSYGVELPALAADILTTENIYGNDYQN